MKIDSLMYDSGPTVYYSAALRRAFRDQLPLLRVAPSTQQAAVDPSLRIKFRGDLYGLFHAMNVAPHLWWIVRELLGLKDCFLVPDSLTHILVPDQNYLDRLAQGIKTGKRLN